MSDVQTTHDRIRAARLGKGIKSLDRLADLIADQGCERPSIAKLSRIETGQQPVPRDILPALSEITGLAPEELRPDWAGAFKKTEAAE